MVMIKCRCGFKKDITTKKEFMDLEKKHDSIYCFFGCGISLKDLEVLK